MVQLNKHLNNAKTESPGIEKVSATISFWNTEPNCVATWLDHNHDIGSKTINPIGIMFKPSTPHAFQNMFLLATSICHYPSKTKHLQPRQPASNSSQHFLGPTHAH